MLPTESDLAAYWTSPEFGAVVKLSAKSIYRLAKKDPTFPCVWIGGSLRIPRDRALKWLRDREQGSRRLHVVKREEQSA
jgi:hypothetical protein